MKGRTAAIGVAAGACAAAALIVSSVGSAKPATRLQDGDRHGHRQPSGPLVQPARERGPDRDRQGARDPDPRLPDASEAERIPNALAACRAGYNLIFGVGFLNYTAINAVAPKCPNPVRRHRRAVRALQRRSRRTRRASSFAEQRGRLPRRLPRGARDQEPGRAADHQRRRREQRPAIVHYISGYIQGAKKANPGIKVLANYANDPTFNDQAKCKETALNQIQQGTRRVFQVAGGCGLGALHAAKEKKRLGHRRRRRPALSRPAHAHERAQAGRTWPSRTSRGWPRRQVRAGGDYHLQPEEQRRRPRLGQPEGAEELRRADGRGRRS